MPILLEAENNVLKQWRNTISLPLNDPSSKLWQNLKKKLSFSRIIKSVRDSYCFLLACNIIQWQMSIKIHNQK